MYYCDRLDIRISLKSLNIERIENNSQNRIVLQTGDLECG